jgi:hypothetical protein
VTDEWKETMTQFIQCAADGHGGARLELLRNEDGSRWRVHRNDELYFEEDRRVVTVTYHRGDGLIWQSVLSLEIAREAPHMCAERIAREFDRVNWPEAERIDRERQQRFDEKVNWAKDGF